MNIFKEGFYTVEHMFAVNGNGIELDNKGYLLGNDRSNDMVQWGAPVPLTDIYPWSKSERYQPFRKYAGCRDVGFKETAQYFIDCVMCTPDEVRGISEWKSNIEVVRSVLMDTPVIQDPYDNIEDSDKFLEDIKAEGSLKDWGHSVIKKWYFDAQGGCPPSVEEEVRAVWRDFELGNDHYMWNTDLDEELFSEYPRIYFWLRSQGVSSGEAVIIHWWW